MRWGLELVALSMYDQIILANMQLKLSKYAAKIFYLKKKCITQ